MQKLHFSIQINAPVEKVWNTMLDDASYREWTAAFNPGSYYKGTWEKGSKMLFLGPDPETGNEGGMISIIAENRPHEFISIEHIGMIQNGVEDTTSDFVKRWTPSHENYTFKSTESGTEILVDMDSDEAMVEEFSSMWPKALARLKEISEK